MSVGFGKWTSVAFGADDPTRTRYGEKEILSNES